MYIDDAVNAMRGSAIDDLADILQFEQGSTHAVLCHRESFGVLVVPFSLHDGPVLRENRQVSGKYTLACERCSS